MSLIALLSGCMPLFKTRIVADIIEFMLKDDVAAPLLLCAEIGRLRGGIKLISIKNILCCASFVEHNKQKLDINLI